jgi:hypothetical protein
MRRKLGYGLLSIFGLEACARGYFHFIDKETPYYDPYKALMRSSRITLAGLRMAMIYAPEYSSESKYHTLLQYSLL